MIIIIIIINNCFYHLERRRSQYNRYRWNDASKDCHGAKSWPLVTRNVWLAPLNHQKPTIYAELIRKPINRNVI